MQDSRYIQFLIDPATRRYVVWAGILVAVVGIIPLVRNAVWGNNGTYTTRFGTPGNPYSIFRTRRFVPPWVAFVTCTFVAAGFLYFCWAAYTLVHALR